MREGCIYVGGAEIPYLELIALIIVNLDISTTFLRPRHLMNRALWMSRTIIQSSNLTSTKPRRNRSTRNNTPPNPL